MIDCIVNLPTKLFLNTQIPACLWFVNRNRKATAKYRDRSNEILFIDARNLGELINRRNRRLTAEHINKIADTYHHWRNLNGSYQDIAGFCNAASIAKVKELDYVLTPGRYVGLEDVADDFDFKEKFTELKAEFNAQLAEETELNKRILTNLKEIEL